MSYSEKLQDMPVRHNIDVMHVEKNVSDALLSILMHSTKSKDGLKARKDLDTKVVNRSALSWTVMA